MQKKLVKKVIKKLSSAATLQNKLKALDPDLIDLSNKFSTNLKNMDPIKAAQTMKDILDKLFDTNNIKDSKEIEKAGEYFISKAYRRQSSNIIPALNELAKLYKRDIKIFRHVDL